MREIKKYIEEYIILHWNNINVYGRLVCARHCVKLNCITCINSFDCLIKCLLKEYTEAFFFSLYRVDSRGGWWERRNKIDTWGKQMLIKFTEIFIQEAREIGWECDANHGSVHIYCVDLVPQNDSYLRLKWIDLLLFPLQNKKDWRESPRLCSGAEYVSWQPVGWRVAALVLMTQQGPLY